MIASVSPYTNDEHQSAPQVVVQSELSRLMQAHPLFQAASDSMLAILLSHLELRCSRHGSWLFREGEPARHCLLVVHGCVEMLRQGWDGQERVYQLCGRGDLAAETSVFMAHGRYSMSARARDDVRCAWLPRHCLREACQRCPVLAMRMLEWMGGRVFQRTNELDWLAGTTAAQRLAAYLLSLISDEGHTSIQLPLSQRQLAGKLGVRPETLNRLFADWQRQGRISGRQRDWQLHDLEALRQLSRGAERGLC
jgi:CRP-like cAMP-binding protein